MYERRMLAVDLPTVSRVAMARNIDIQEAQQRVAASHGEYEASIHAYPVACQSDDPMLNFWRGSSWLPDDTPRISEGLYR